MANNSSWKDEGSLNFVLNNPGYQKAQAKYNEEHGIQSSNEAGNISLPAPYAVLIEPYEKGNKTNVSNSGDNYQKTLNAYNEAKRRLIDQTDEARDIKDTWSAAPRVTLENGNLMLNGTRKFLDSDTGKELQKTLKDMEGQTYNSEDLNKQIEAWNATLSKMADEYSKAADSLNIANAALADTAGNAEYHKLTLGDLQKVSNSATIGKGADARTSKKKIFVGFEWDDDGNLIERWVEAKKFFEEFNSVNDDEKRRAYRDLIVQANNGDVGAYSKLMYLNGGAEGKPANVEYNAVGDFFHTLGEHLLVGLSEAADFVTTYVPIFNTSRLTGRVVRAAESGDINEFFAPDEIRKNIDSYKETLAWEDAYFSELTPGSTALAAQTGNVVGNFLGMAYSIWAGGVGNTAAAKIVTQGINRANQALLATGNFTAFERTAITGTQQALGGAVRTSASTSQFLMPTAIVENFPRLSSFLADKALSFSQYTGIGLTGTSTGDALAGASRAATVTENTITMPGRTAGTLVARGTSAGNITATVVSGGTAMGSRTLGTLSGGALVPEQVFAKGIQTAFRLAPLAGETVLRTTDQYFQKVYMGEDPGDMTEYIINNTAEALIWGGAFMAAGAKIRELKQIARAARQSPVSATAGGYSKADSSQSDWCGTRYNTTQEPQRLLTPGMELEKDIQDLVSSVVTVNGESFFVSPNRTAVATGYEGGEIVDGVMETTPTSIEFAPIPNSAGEAGAAFGAASAKKITKYEVERALSGADLIETAIDVETGTTTTTRRHFDTLEAANDAAKTASVPKASPRTIANSDALRGANVAPLSVNGEVLPKVDGVTQVKVQRGIIYRTPDDMVDDLANIAGAEGWSAENQDRLYREYQQYVEEARSAQENAIYVQEAPDYPKDIVGTDVEMYLRTAAWAKANGYNLVPMKTAAVTTRRYKKFSMQDKFISKLVDKYNFPEIDIRDTVDNKRTPNRQGQRSNAVGSGVLNLAGGSENPIVSIFPSADYGVSLVGEKPVLADVLPKDAYDIVKAFGWLKIFDGVVGNDPTKELRKEINKVEDDTIDAYVEAVGIVEFSSKTALEDMIYRIKSLFQTLGANEPKETLVKNVSDLLNRNLDGRIKTIDDDTWAVPEWKAAAKKLVDKYRPRVNEAAKLLVDVALDRIDMGTRSVNGDIQNISNVVDDALHDASVKLLSKKLSAANSKLSSGIKIEAIESDIPGVYVTGSLIPNAMESKVKILHVPEGTKYIAPRDRLVHIYQDGETFAFDGSNGVTERDGELYLNLPNGAAYTPAAAQYDLSRFAIYNQDDVSGYKDLRDWMKPIKGIKKAQGEAKDYWVPSVFNMVAPGGPVNQNNKVLRENGGKIPKDTLAERAKAAEKDLEYLRNFFKNEDTYELPQILSARKRAQNIFIGKVISNRTVEGSRLDRMRSYHDNFGAGGDGLTDEEKKIAREMFDDIDATFEGTEDRLVNETENGTKTVGIDRIIDEFEKTVNELAKKWGKVLGTSKKDMSPWFRLVDTWGRKGSHTLNLPEGVDYLWTFRGNPGNDAATDQTWMSTWRPGDHINSSSLDFNSLNTFTPYRYSNEYDQEEYVLAIGHPNGSGVFYFGDPSNFGDRVHRADGGAIVTPFNMGMTVTAIRTIGKNDAGKDVKLIIAIRDNADGTPYSGPIEGGGGGVEKAGRVQVRGEDEVIEEENKFLVTQYGVPERWFQYKEEAMDYAERMGERAVYEIDDSADALERPPVTVDNLKALQPGEPLLKLSAGGYPTEAIRRFNELMIALPTLESPEDYTRGVIDIVYQVQAIYNQVAVNVDIASIYENYGKAIAEGREPEAMPVEMEALRPLLQVFDALGHYFDPSGKSLTQKFYLPTMLKPNKKVSILDAILGKDDVVDVDSPVDGGLDDILLDPTRVGDSGFWQQRSGDLFRDAEGNFTMDKAAPLEDAVVAYTVSALTRGKNKLYVAAQNEVARSKFDRNRAQITSKQALAGLKDADTVRTKAKAIQAKISKDAEALAELKENYSGDEGTIDKAIEEKNYADELDYTRSVNTMAQKLGYNQFMQMNNIPGTVARFGANSTGFRGIANIRRKLEKINVTGTMWVERFGEKVNVGFGLEPTPSNQQIYGSFRPEKAINLGQLINMNFDSDRAAVVFLNQINEKISTWSEGDGWDLMAAISEFARVNFPLSGSEWYTAQLMKKLGQNYNSFHDPEEIFIANAEAISGWIARGTLDTFNKAIQMSNISSLDTRTIRALDEAAAYMLIGTPVKRSKVINYAQEAAVWSALGLNPRVAIGNVLNEPLRLIDVVGYRGFAKAWNTALNPKEAARINAIISDLPSRFDNPEMVGLAEKAKGTFGKLKEKAASVALSPLEKSEQFKNILFWAAAEDNARARFPGDPKKQLQETLRFFNDYAIAGGKGTVPGVATGSFGRTLNIFKTFTLRNFDDFIDYVQKVARGESGNNYWDEKYKKKHGGKNYKDKTGRNKFDPKIAARVIGGRVFRSYLFWLLVGSYFGKSFTDALGGDPSGITDGGFDRGLYDDPDTDEYEGMTDFDNFINSLPAGFILGFLQDVYFAARRRGIESKQFLGFDIMNDPRFTKSLESKLPLGVAKNRFADMLDLVDRGYSFSSTGRKTYAAPETAVDTIKGFLFGKATTQNSLAYGKYRYGMVDVWGDLSSGDWMDFAMNANPFSGNATFDTTRKDYTGVFNGSWNDVSTMQLIIQQFRERNKQIIADFQENKYRYRGEYEGLTDEEKLAKAREQREKDIDAFTDDVTRAVDAFEKAGNTLNDNQITNIMYLFDFHEGEEDEEWNSSYARKRYVEAGLPDYNAAAIERGEKTVDGEKQEVTKGMLDRSLVLENAQQGFYGSSKEAANAVKTALKDFKSVYKEYNTRVKALNEKYFEARKKNKKSAETKQLNKDIEALQNEYLDRLYNQLSPVVEQYGTALIGTYDVADVLEEYMGNMIPYSSIKKYDQTYSSGNDIVYGQLTEWLQKRWGRNGPTAPSDKEVTSGIEEIRNLLDQGKTASARSKARAILEKIGRGSLGARRDDVETLRDYAYD